MNGGGLLRDLGHKFRQIDQMFKLRMNNNLEELDITIAQMHVLGYLGHHEGEKVTQKILAQEFNVKHPTMSGILQRMQEKGLISISVDENNKKYKNIIKTKKADKIKDEMDKYRDYTEAVLTDGFSDDEINTLSKLLDKVYNNLMNDSNMSDEETMKFERRHHIK